jgi:C4-dicarboxylate transporter, DctM subunit
MNDSHAEGEKVQNALNVARECGVKDQVGKFEKVRNIIDAVSDYAGKTAGILLLVLAFCTFYEVIVRLLGHPTSWELEICEMLMLWASFLGMSYTFKKDGHIIVDIVFVRAGKSTKRICNIFNFILMLGYCLIFTVKGAQLTWSSIISGQKIPSAFASPLWITQAVIPVGCLLLLLQVLRSMPGAISKPTEEGARLDNTRTPDMILMACLGMAVLGVLSIVLFPGYFVGIRIFALLAILIFPLLFIGMPVGFVLGILGITGLSWVVGVSHGLTQLPVIAWRSIAEYVLTAVPLFIMCSSLFLISDLGSDLFSVASLWVRHLRGGLGIAAIGACAIFAAITGSSVACAATIGLVAIPELVKAKYDRKFALGTLAAGGTLGIMIPPSIPFIVYGLLTTQSIGQLFIAGVIPGVVLALIFSGFIYIRHRFLVPTHVTVMPPASWGERFKGTLSSFWGLMGPVIILGGIYSGIFTPTEAASVAVVYGLFVTIIVRKRTGGIMKVLMETAKTTSMITFIIVGAMLVGQTITLLKIPNQLVDYILSGGNILSHKYVVLLIINVILLILGSFLEIISILLITTPIFFPLIVSLGFDPLWFGVLVTLNMELAAITPPVGLNLYVIMGLYRDKLEDVVQGAIPYIVLMVLFLVALTVWPQMALWLPSMMKP